MRNGRSTGSNGGASSGHSVLASILVRVGRPRSALSLLLAAGLCYILLINGHHRHYLAQDNNSIIQDDESNSSLISTQEQMALEMNRAEPKVILYWTGYYNRPDMVFGFGQEPFKAAGCRVTNCYATANRSMLNQSDAIIFHAGDYKPEDLPGHRLPNQRYIFYLFETLPNGRHMPYFSSNTDHYFNWTMSHRRDSDVYIAEPYGALRRKVNAAVVDQLPPYLPPDGRPPLPSDLMTYPDKKLTNKTKMVAWFCSNTVTHGRREDYIRELQKHVQVDIYGKCGNLTCQPRNSPQCNNLLDNYKFYLSAENSLCPDYITEKFYRALQTDVVPIVYGGADYAQYAPPHSFIHVADFASPKHLAEYLHFLDRNEAMYLKYFDWKKDWEVVKRPLNGWCDLCEKLNDPRQEPKSYESISKWWYDDLPCYPGSSFIQSVLKNV